MSDSAVMITEAHISATMATVKFMGLATVSFFGAIYTGVTAAIGGAEDNTVAIGTTLGLSVTFAGLILRMVIKNQGAIWDIVRSKDVELVKKDLVIHQLTLKEEYTAWEREQARFRANERTDPGPFLPSPQLMTFPTMGTISSDPS